MNRQSSSVPAFRVSSEIYEVSQHKQLMMTLPASLPASTPSDYPGLGMMKSAKSP